jgi:Adenylate and Guanylate cyclase catalytic domain
LPQPLSVRIGIHTGLVVAGEMGSGETREPLAIVGETPNIAARLQELAAPNRIVLSAATYRLVQGYFECQSLGPQSLKGVSLPLEVYHVLGEGGAHRAVAVFHGSDAPPQALAWSRARGDTLCLTRPRFGVAWGQCGRCELVCCLAHVGIALAADAPGPR